LENSLKYFKNLYSKIAANSENHLFNFLNIKYGLCSKDYYLKDNLIFNTKEIQEIEFFFKDLSSGIPFEYIVNQASFYDSEFFVDERVLIPRPETELIIDYFKSLKTNKNFNIIDAGTGSGCIGISIANLCNQNMVFGVDKYLTSIEIAKINKNKLNANNFKLLVGDWLLPFKKNSIDIVISNPPYITEDDEHLMHLKHEPLTSLVSTDNGLNDIKTIIKQSKKVLKTSGKLIIEHGFNQAQDIENILKDYNYRNIFNIKDYQGHQRIIVAEL
jgi:release factor glutamine methyltransferase